MKTPGDGPDPDLAPPHAASLVESMRAFGYDLATALADLADNSLFARARHIRLHFHWDGEASAIALADDGNGMDEPTLINAMRMGSRNPREPRELSDLGRFGLGLKTASFSQCRRVTVFTRTAGANVPVIRCWDLDHVAQTDLWQLLREPLPLAARLAEDLVWPRKGTVVVWEKLDRLTAGTRTGNDFEQDAFLRRAEQVGEHFAAMFHRLMEGPDRVEFTINGRPLKPWDPFLADEKATQRLPVERLRCEGEMVEVEPFVLPHLSKINAAAHKRAAGLRGWNAHQGFYIYRNHRLLVAGDWLGLKGWRQEEHYKLARIRVDLPNALDHAWEIDVTKSRARAPEGLRAELARIGECTRTVAKRVYSFRGARLIPAEGKERIFLWHQKAKHGRVSYALDREHPLVRQSLAACRAPATLHALLRLIEETVPVPLITITDREKPDQTVGPFEEAKTSEMIEVMRQAFNALRATGYSASDAVSRLRAMEPFPRFPAELQSFLEKEPPQK
jgi:hypothetical protein